MLERLVALSEEPNEAISIFSSVPKVALLTSLK